MKFSLRREVLLKPLQQVSNVVEKRQTLPVLSNLLLQVENGRLKLTATDLEVELQASVDLEQYADGEITVPARKLHDICRSLPDGVEIHLEVVEDKCRIRAGRSRYTLSTLPANDFPTTEQLQGRGSLSIEQKALSSLLSSSAFAMAQQDIRYFLNGMLLELKGNRLRAVATDGHRLALSQMQLEEAADEQQMIVPRKAILEMMRLLEDEEEPAELELGEKHIRMRLPGLVFTSKLIDGKYPDYEAVIPVGVDNRIQANRELLIETIRRTAILSNEKYRAIRLEVGGNTLRLSAHNTEQEEAVEEMEVDYQGQELKVVFNFAYLLDAMNALRSEQVQVCLRDAMTSCLIREPENDGQLHVVMPLKL